MELRDVLGGHDGTRIGIKSRLLGAARCALYPGAGQSKLGMSAFGDLDRLLKR